jgi:hypothetical protein
MALAAAGGAVAGAVAAVAGEMAGLGLPWAVTVPTGLVIGVLAGTAGRLPPGDPDSAPATVQTTSAVTTAFGDLGALRFSVEQDSRDADRFEVRLRPRLSALAVERLWQRHRLDWRTDAGRTAARPLLPPGVLELLTAPPHTLRLTPQTLARWTRDLEDL